MIWYVGNGLVYKQQNVCQVYHFSLKLEMPSSIDFLHKQKAFEFPAKTVQ